MPNGPFQSFAAGAKKIATYRVTDVGRAAYASTTDLWQLVGAVGKFVRLRRIKLVGRATAAGQVDVNILKRTTLNTGGTITALPASYESGDPAPSAVASVITAAPTLGTLQGGVDCDQLILTAAGTAQVGGNEIVFDFTTIDFSSVLKAPGLNSATDSLVINLGTWTTAAGNVFDMAMTWTEV